MEGTIRWDIREHNNLYTDVKAFNDYDKLGGRNLMERGQ